MTGVISSIGRTVLDTIARAGHATRFFVRLVLEFFPLLRRPRLVTKQIHFVGNYSLLITPLPTSAQTSTPPCICDQNAPASTPMSSTPTT